MTFMDLALKGVAPLESGELPLLVKLTRHAELALRSGLPLPPYLEVDWLVRRAFIAAADRLRGQAAQRAGLAATGPLGAALAGAEADGGEAAEAVFLEQQTALALANIRAETEASLRG